MASRGYYNTHNVQTLVIVPAAIYSSILTIFLTIFVGELLPPNIKGKAFLKIKDVFLTSQLLSLIIFICNMHTLFEFTGRASALATSFNWLNTFVVTKAFDNIKVSK